MRNQADPKINQVLEDSKAESVTTVPGNNGDALSCVVLMTDGVARDSNASVDFETVHEEKCHLLSLADQEIVSNEAIREHEASSVQARQHLYLCNCQATVEATFVRENGDSLLVRFCLDGLKKVHPWLDDEKETQKILESDRDSPHPLLNAMKLHFKENMRTKISDPEKMNWTNTLTTTAQ